MDYYSVCSLSVSIVGWVHSSRRSCTSSRRRSIVEEINYLDDDNGGKGGGLLNSHRNPGLLCVCVCVRLPTVNLAQAELTLYPASDAALSCLILLLLYHPHPIIYASVSSVGSLWGVDRIYGGKSLLYTVSRWRRKVLILTCCWVHRERAYMTQWIQFLFYARP